MTGFPGLPPQGGDARTIATIVNRLLAGKLNATLDVTLTANAASTVVTDSRISGQSFLALMPLTASAAAEKAGGTLFVSSQGKGTATLSHQNSADATRSYRLLILG